MGMVATARMDEHRERVQYGSDAPGLGASSSEKYGDVIRDRRKLGDGRDLWLFEGIGLTHERLTGG